MKIYKSYNVIINLEEVNYITKQQSRHNDKYYLIFSMKNGSEFYSAEASAEKIIIEMEYIAKLMEIN